MGRSDVVNAFETTLSTQMGPSDLTADVASVGSLTSPCYIVIDPDSQTKREYMLMDGAFGASSFVTTVLANRYLPGSAQGSGITHDAGAVVRFMQVSQLWDDVWDEVDAQAAAFAAHDGAASGHPVATGATDGLMAAADKSKLDGIDSGAQADHDGLTGITTDNHHSEVHAIGGAAHTGQLAHADLSDAPADAHHARYTDAEAEATMRALNLMQQINIGTDTVSAVNVWETWGSELSIAQPVGSYFGALTVQGSIQVTEELGAAERIVECRLVWSVDGGASWVNGTALPAEGSPAGTHIHTVPLAHTRMVSLSGFTGDFKLKAEIRIGSGVGSTNLFQFVNGRIGALLVPRT